MGEDVLRVGGSSADQTKNLQKIMIIMSAINLVILLSLQFMIFNETTEVLYKWVDDNVEQQIFDEVSRTPKYIQAFKQSQSVSTKRYIFGTLIYFNFMAFAMFTTMNGFIIFGAHKLSRNQKKTEED